MMKIILPLRLKIFALAFFLTFIMVGLQQSGIELTHLISPLQSEEKEDIFQIITPKLEEKKNTYTLNQESSLIKKAQATAEISEANSYVVIDYDTGTILTDKMSDTPFPMASLTKVMTAVVALDLASPEELFTVSKNAASQIPTKIGVRKGEELSLLELLEATLLTSANDAAEVIKEGIDTKYGEAVFIEAMNRKASFLGLHNTHFTNPQGFDNRDHYSSAKDLAILTAYAMQQYPLFTTIVQKDYEFLAENSYHKQFDLYNWNGLLGVYPGVLGVKIGNTEAAQRTTIVLAQREGKKILVVLLGAPGIKERDLWAATLLDSGFDTYGLPPVNVTEEQLLEKYETWQY